MVNINLNPGLCTYLSAQREDGCSREHCEPAGRGTKWKALRDFPACIPATDGLCNCWWNSPFDTCKRKIGLEAHSSEMSACLGKFKKPAGFLEYSDSIVNSENAPAKNIMIPSKCLSQWKQGLNKTTWLQFFRKPAFTNSEELQDFLGKGMLTAVRSQILLVLLMLIVLLKSV